MNKTEFCGKIYEYLRNNNIRKPVSIPRQTFTITDDEGHSRVFTVKRRDRLVLYTMKDIKDIVDGFIQAMVECIARGDVIQLPRIGSISAQYRAETKVRIPGSHKWQTIPAHYVPKARFAKAMCDAAKIYEAFLIENGQMPTEAKGKRPSAGRPKNEERMTVDKILALNAEKERAPFAELLQEPEDYFNEPDSFDEDEDFGFDDDEDDVAETAEDTQEDMELSFGVPEDEVNDDGA